jgi:transcriptional regulator with XRE-family HTH domain
MTLQQLCAARGLTREALAERAGVPLTAIVKIDAGTLRVQPSILRRLARALGIAAATLQGELSDARRRQEIPRPTGTWWG